MRQNTTSENLACTDTEYFPDGRINTYTYRTTKESSNVVRSDIVKTAKNQNGWREPTPYGVQSLKTLFPFGSVQVDETYFTTPPQTYHNEVNGYLGLSNYAKVNALRPITANDAVLNGANVANRLVVNCLNQVRSQKINLAVAFAESRKTASMIADRTLSLYRSYRDLRKGNITSAWKHLALHPGNRGRKIAKSTLEVQYGWRPLMSDIYGGYEALSRDARTEQFLIKTKASTSSPSYETTSYNGSTTGSSPFLVIQEDVLLQRSQVVLWYSVTSELLLSASSVGLTDPLSVVWELTPYSFLIDWIAPVGDLLSALSATQGTRFIGGTLTHSSRFTRHYNIMGTTVAVSGGKWTGSGLVKSDSEAFNMSRTVYKTSPFPTPFVKNPFSVEHGINAVALLRGLK